MTRFEAAVAAIPAVQARVAKGQQFNAYELVDRCEQNLGWQVSLGPITDHFGLVNTSCEEIAELLVAALREAFVSDLA